ISDLKSQIFKSQISNLRFQILDSRRIPSPNLLHRVILIRMSDSAPRRPMPRWLPVAVLTAAAVLAVVFLLFAYGAPGKSRRVEVVQTDAMVQERALADAVHKNQIEDVRKAIAAHPDLATKELDGEDAT